MSEAPSTEAIFCANHPDRETGLRCNRCGKPICADCAVLTPTGYRCPECVRSQQKKFETARWFDYPLAVVVAGGLSYLGSWIAARLGFFTLFLAPGAGILIAEVVRALVRRRRGARLFKITTAAAALGALPLVVQVLLILILGGLGGGGLNILFPLLWQGYYLFIVPSTVFTRLSGIQLRR